VSKGNESTDAIITNKYVYTLVILSIEGMPSDLVTHAPPEDLIVEARAQKQDQEALDVDEDLDGRSAYVNNQFVPNEPVEMIDDEQNAPLYEILQKQMEQVLASTGPDVPIYEDDKSKRPRDQQLPHKPLFTNNNEADPDDDYVDEASESEQGYGDAEKPDATAVEELVPDTGYQVQQPSTSSVKPTDSTTTKPSSSFSTSTTRSRPQRRRTTTAIPRTTRSKNNSQSKVTATTASSINPTELATSTVSPASSSHKQRPNTNNSTNSSSKHNLSSSSNSNNLPHDPQIYQHKRRIIFKTISTGSQFVNSPIGDLMIKFSIGFAKPAQGTATPSNEALRALSNNLFRNIEMQKFKRIKLHKD